MNEAASTPDTAASFLDSLRRRLDYVVRLRTVTRGMIAIFLMEAAAGWLLTMLPQGRDLTLATLESRSAVWTFPLSAVLSFVFGGEAWFWSRYVISRSGGDEPQWDGDVVLERAPQLLGVAPAILACTSAVVCRADALPTVSFIACHVATLGGLFAFRLWIGADSTGGRLSRFTRRLRRWSFLAAALGMIAATVAPVAFGHLFGSVGVVYLGLALIIPVLAWLVDQGRAFRLPVTEGLLLWSALVSLAPHLDLVAGDPHQVGRRGFGLTAAGSPLPPRPTFAQAFADWWDRAPPAATKPMIVFAIEGGASRAGYWTAEVLGRLHEGEAKEGRTFSDNVFALSSVSGGSVGATAYVSQLHDDPRPAGSLRGALTDIAGDDFLSPALAGLLFPDLAQHFFVPLRLPFAPRADARVLALPDRAEALERAFEAGWRRHCAASSCRDRDLWSKPFLSLHSGGAPWTPLLVINGAREEDGRRILTAPFVVQPGDFPDAVDALALTGRDIPISTAIHNGARFPIVSPGGALVDHAGGSAGHVLDGGYFEGGGVVTARDLVLAAVRASRGDPAHGLVPRPIRPIIVEINNDQDLSLTGAALSRGDRSRAPNPGAVAPLKPPASTKYFLGDLIGPLLGVSQSRDGRGVAAATATAYDMADARAVPPGAWGVDPQYVLLHLCLDRGRGMAMNWALSNGSRHVSAQAFERTPDGCGVQQATKAIEALLSRPQ